MKNNKLLAQANALFALANVIVSLNQFFHRPQAAQRADEIAALKAENLRLKNQVTHIQTAVTSNRVVEGDLKIELLTLKIARERAANQAAGIGGPTFKADNYKEPGDIRRGIHPPE